MGQLLPRDPQIKGAALVSQQDNSLSVMDQGFLATRSRDVFLMRLLRQLPGQLLGM